MKITQVEGQKKNPHRFNIFLDGEFAFGADEDLVVNRRLVVGKEIPQQDLEKILFEAEVGKLMERMYRLFNIRPRSEKEVRDYFRRKNFELRLKDKEERSGIVIDEVVSVLKKKELLDDERFARDWAASRRSSKKKGKIAIKAELFQKGIDRDVIEEAVNSQSSGMSEEKVATEALQKKIKVWQHLPYLEKKQKALEFLVRRGFEYSVARDVVEKMLKKDYNSSYS